MVLRAGMVKTSLLPRSQRMNYITATRSDALGLGTRLGKDQHVALCKVCHKSFSIKSMGKAAFLVVLRGQNTRTS